MATFDTYADTPFQIKTEGQEIVVRQTRLSPTTIRVSWSFPAAIKCNTPYAYNGAVVTLDQQPTNQYKLPSNGSIYEADPSADINLHTGSKIGTALVVGAIYDDVLTGSVDITDAPDSKAFYVSVHAVDKQYRYHVEGAHAYSLPYGKEPGTPGSGSQVINIGISGTTLDAPTNLNPGQEYSFKITVDQTVDIPMRIMGDAASTYGELIHALNQRLMLRDNPTVSTQAPNDGAYWLDIPNKLLKQFNHDHYDIKNPVFFAVNDPLLPNVGDYWFNSTDGALYAFDAGWNNQAFYVWPRDPRNPYCNDYWIAGTTVRMWNGGTWVVQSSIDADLDPALPPIMTCNNYWVNAGKVYQWNEKTCMFEQRGATSNNRPTSPVSGQLWLDVANMILYIYSDTDADWIDVHASFASTDPSVAITIAQGSIWHDTISNEYFKRDGTSWVKIRALMGHVKPQQISDGALWFHETDKKWYKMAMGLWTTVTVMTSPFIPNVPAVGSFWYRQPSDTLYQYDGMAWASVPFSKVSIAPVVGTLWYDTSGVPSLVKWTGTTWATIYPIAEFSLNAAGNILITSNSTGSKSWACITDVGTLWTAAALSPTPRPMQPKKGTDPVSSVPSYIQVGVGTDGSVDERRNMITRIKNALGYPVMEVELTKEQMEQAVDMALEKLRAISSAPYKRGYFALDLQPRVQQYVLTDETVGFNKITDIMYLYRQTATFLGVAAGNDVYGQMIIQNLFTSGKFDLVSYHMMSSYIETMQQIFASEIQYKWDEYTRTLTIFKDFPRAEKVLVDAMVERTEQDLMTDRKLRPWIQKYATAQCRYMLAEIRGKFSTLPGAGGNVTLNASDLRSAADKEVQECIEDVDNYTVDGKTEFGMATDFVLG